MSDRGWTKVLSGAAYAGVSVSTFRGWLKQGLPHAKLPSGTILVRFEAIDSFLNTFEVEGGRDRLDDLVDEVVGDLVG